MDAMARMHILTLFYVMTKRRVNLNRLIMHYLLFVIKGDKKKNNWHPYGMLLIRVFKHLKLPLVGERIDDSRSVMSTKTFSMLGYQVIKSRREVSEGQKEKAKEKITIPLEAIEIVAKVLSKLGSIEKKKK